MRSLRLVICALAVLAFMIPLSLCVFADGTDTAGTASHTAETVMETAAPADTAAGTDASASVDTGAQTDDSWHDRLVDSFSAHKKEHTELLSENSDLLLFIPCPDESGKVTADVIEYGEKDGEPFVSTLITIEYASKEAFEKETERLSSYGLLEDAGSSNNAGKYFETYTLVSLLGADHCSEYVIVDSEAQTLRYVYLRNITSEESHIDLSFLPKGYSGRGVVEGDSFDWYQAKKDHDRIAYGRIVVSYIEKKRAEEDTSNYAAILVACAAACIIIPYLLGSINSGIIVSKLFHKEDIRSYGSGNAGATNMLRTYGKRDAAITFLGDVAKSVAAVALGRVLLGLTGGYIALFCCIIGHAFPVFYKFKGGKGVAVSAGGVAALFAFTPDWWIILAELAIFIVVVAITRFISLGSVIAMFVFPLLMSRFELGWSLNILFSFMIAALVIYLHRGNIKRIYKGTESKFTLKHTDKHEKEE